MGLAREIETMDRLCANLSWVLGCNWRRNESVTYTLERGEPQSRNTLSENNCVGFLTTDTFFISPTIVQLMVSPKS